MALLSDILKRRNKNDNKVHEGTNTPTGNSNDFITPLSVAIGMLLTGVDIKDHQDLIGKVKGKGKPDAKNSGILGLLKNISNNTTDIVLGKNNFKEFHSYIKIAEENQKNLKDVVSELKNAKSEIPKFFKNVNSINSNVQSILNTLIQQEKSNSGNNINETSISGNSDFSDLLDSIKTFNLSEKTIDSFDELQDMTSKGGSIYEIFHNIDELNNMNVDFKSFKSKMNEINDTAVVTTAVNGKVDSKDIKNSTELFEGIKTLMVGVIGVSLLFIVVGLLGDKINYASIIKFTTILSVFLGALMLIFVLAHRALKPNGVVMSGLHEFSELVVTTGMLLLFAGVLGKFLSAIDMMLFPTILSVFLHSIVSVFKNFKDIFENEKIGETIHEITEMIAMSGFILIFGSLMMNFINPANLILFTVTLGLFIFTTLSVFALAHKLYGEGGGMEGMKDAAYMIVGSAFIMFLGAAVMPALNIKNLFAFTITLGLFLFVILGIFKLVGLSSKGEAISLKKGEKAHNVPSGMRDALFLVVGSAFILFLGAAIMPALNYGSLILFTGTLAAFMWAVLSPYIIFKKSINKAGYTAKQFAWLVVLSGLTMLIGGYILMENPAMIVTVPLFATMLAGFIWGITKAYYSNAKRVQKAIPTATAIMILTGISAATLLIGGYLIAKNPNMAWAVLEFGVILGAFILAMTGIMYILGKISNQDIGKSILALGGISLCVTIISGSFFILSEIQKNINKAGGLDVFTSLVWTVMEVLGAMAVGLVGLGALLGNPPVAIAVTAAIGVVLAASAAFGIVSYSLLNLADALDKLSKIKEFDMSPLINIIKGIIGVMKEMAPLGLVAPLLFAAEAAILGLTKVVSDMAETVKDYADLKIKIYDGTKHVGYRRLERSDFDAAANNISLIVTTLTQGIMTAYEMHDDWYSTISWSSFWSGGKSPLQRVIRQSKELAPLISRIARSVKEYADLKIATKWDNEGNAIEFRHLGASDFDNAAKNVSLVLSTLTAGVMQTYIDHSEWFGGDISALWGLGALLGPVGMVGAAIGATVQGTRKSPLQKVLAQTQLLPRLISKVASAVKDYADLKITTRWDKEGKGIEFRSITDMDFTKASKNVTKVLSILCEGIMKVYKDNEQKGWFEESCGGLGKSPLEKVINTNKKLSELISVVADDIKDYADLKIPIDWDKDGKAKNFKQITDGDFIKAAKNVTNVLEVLGTGIMTVWNTHQDNWFKESWGGLGKSPFEKVINTNKKLSELISDVAAGVKDYADLKIPTRWENGKAVEFKEMGHEDFKLAGQNIGTVITTTMLGLMGYIQNKDGSYKEGPAFEIIKKYILADDDDAHEAFDRVLDSSVKIGSVVSSLATGISNFSKMMFPDYSGGIDENGNPKKGYKELNTEDFSKAAQCITTVIITVAQALIDEANGLHSDWWKLDDDEEFEKSPLYNILSASEKIGTSIGNIAKGLADYANMKIPTAFDKDGKATGWIKLTQGDLKNAASKITEVISTTAGALIGIYKYKPELWQIRTEVIKNFFGSDEVVTIDTMSPIERVIDASAKMGTVIESIARGIVMFAGGQFGDSKEPVKITKDTLGLAKTAITDVLINTVATVAALNNNSTTKALFNDKNLNIILNAINQAGNVISSVATAVQNIAALSIPNAWDKNGKPISFTKMGTQDFTDASTNIKKIVGTIGKAFNEIMNDANNSWLQYISDSPIQMFNSNSTGTMHSSGTIAIVINSIKSLAETLSIISGCIYGYATMRFPKGVDNNGIMQYSEPLSDQKIQDAKLHIKTVVISLGEAMMDIINDPTFSSLNSKSSDNTTDMNDVVEFVNNGSSAITEISGAITSILEDESIKKLPTTIKLLSTTNKNLSTVINSFYETLKLLFGGDEKYGSATIDTKLFGEIKITYSFSDIIKKYVDKIDGVGNSTSSLMNTVFSILLSFTSLNEYVNATKTGINELKNTFTKDNYVSTIDTVVTNTSELFATLMKLNNLDENLTNTKTISDVSLGRRILSDVEEVFTLGAAETDRDTLSNLDAEYELNKLRKKIHLYTDFMGDTLLELIKINSIAVQITPVDYSNVATSLQGFFYVVKTVNSSFGNMNIRDIYSITSVITTYTGILKELNNIDVKSLERFKAQNTQIEKFVKTLNSIKLLNLNQMNKFITSLNQLANKMGNLDRLTDAIANRLSKVLEELVKRLIHAETTIMKADKIQERRHELIKKSVEEVSNLMKQPMTVEIQSMSSSATTEESSTDTTKTT